MIYSTSQVNIKYKIFFKTKNIHTQEEKIAPVKTNKSFGIYISKNYIFSVLIEKEDNL